MRVGPKGEWMRMSFIYILLLNNFNLDSLLPIKHLKVHDPFCPEIPKNVDYRHVCTCKQTYSRTVTAGVLPKPT